MKKSLARPRSFKSSGFTLVELLVVIGIIAILAGVVLTAGNNALRAAQRARAQNMATQIQTSVLSYYSEYGVYPVPSGSPTGDYFISDGTGDQTNWKNIIEALCGNLSPSKGTANLAGLTVSNTRAIAFLQMKATDVDSNDGPLNPASYDSVNHPYFNMGIDFDYSGIVGDTGTAPSPGMPNFSTSTQGNIKYLAQSTGVTAQVAVWANCNTTTTTTLWNPNYFVKTY